jgi:CHASE3 domain sensor protein
MEELDDTLAASINLQARSTAADAAASSQQNPKTLERLEAHLSEIKSLTADNPKQQRALERLAALVRARSALQPGGEAPSVPDSVGKSKDLLDQIRLVLLGMRQEEERLEAVRLQAVESEKRTARTALAAGYTLTIIRTRPSWPLRLARDGPTYALGRAIAGRTEKIPPAI